VLCRQQEIEGRDRGAWKGSEPSVARPELDSMAVEAELHRAAEGALGFEFDAADRTVDGTGW